MTATAACSNSYTLVLHKHGDLLYAGVTECVTSKLHGISKVVHSATVERLLEVIVREWEQHKLIMTMIRDILMYMVCVLCTTLCTLCTLCRQCPLRVGDQPI